MSSKQTSWYSNVNPNVFLSTVILIGVFLVIVEQNTESSMKGTDFIAHATRKFPQLAESDFILMTHRIELVPAKNHNFPVLEKPLRAPQIRQLVQQKIKQAQELIDMQIHALQQKNEKFSLRFARRIQIISKIN